MGAGIVKIRVLQSFSCYEAGQVFEDWPGGMCEVLIGRGLIEQIKEPVLVERAVATDEVERATIEHKRKKAK